MSAVAKYGCTDQSGHNIQASGDVFCESLGVVRFGDEFFCDMPEEYEEYVDENEETQQRLVNGHQESGYITSASSTVFVNNKRVARLGDTVSYECNHDNTVSGGCAGSVTAG